MSHICPTLARLCGGRRTISIGDDLYHVLADLAEGATSHVVLVRKRKDEACSHVPRAGRNQTLRSRQSSCPVLVASHMGYAELYALKLICMSREKASSIDNEIKVYE
eukprot:5819899-Pleurochrysis_carterae.AAC.5